MITLSKLTPASASSKRSKTSSMSSSRDGKASPKMSTILSNPLTTILWRTKPCKSSTNTPKELHTSSVATGTQSPSCFLMCIALTALQRQGHGNTAWDSATSKTAADSALSVITPCNSPVVGSAMAETYES